MKKLLIFLLLSLPLHAQRTNLTAEDAQTVTGPKAFTGGITNIGGCAATNGSQVVGNGTSFACQSKPFFDMRDYSPRTITLAAPTSAPTLTITTPVWGRNAFASGHTICAEQTYVGVDAGETTASGTNCVVISANHPAVAVFPSAPFGARGSVGANIYVNDNGGTFAATLTGPDAHQKPLGFGDYTSWGGVIVGATTAGSPPGVNSAHDGDGTLITAPTTAPTIFLLGNLPLNTTFYAAFTYIAGDGTETGLSPVSASHTTPAVDGSLAEITLPLEPPSGAVCVNEYLSTDGSTWHKQANCIPLAYVTYDVHTYNASGASPSAGTAQSTLCEFQQSYDAAMTAGGGTVIVPVKSGDWACSTPVILHTRNNSNTYVAGMKVMGLAGHDFNGGNAHSSINYTGTQSGVDCVVSIAGGLVLSGVDFKDTNKRCSAGIEYADWGSASFQNHYSDCSFSGLAVNGFGLSVPRWGSLAPAGTNHVASEQYFDFCTFLGGGWNIDIHSPQSVDFRFKDVTMGSAQNTPTANSGDVRIESGNAQFNGLNSDCDGEYLTYQTDDQSNGAGGGGGATLTLERVFSNTLLCPYMFYISPLSTEGPSLAISHSTLTNNTAHQQTSFYIGSYSTVELHDNQQIGYGASQNIVFNQTGATKNARLINHDTGSNMFGASYLSAFGFSGGFPISLQEHLYGSAGIDFWNKSGNSLVLGTVINGNAVASPLYQTSTNCQLGGASGTTSPAACGAAPAGKVAIPSSAGTSYTVNTSAVTVNSEIIVQQTTDNSGLPSSPTCNTNAELPAVKQMSRSAATSFTLSALSNPPAITCFEYWIVN